MFCLIFGVKSLQVLLAVGGKATRWKKDGLDVPISKSFFNFNGKPLLYYSLTGLLEAGVNSIVVTAENDEKLTRAKEVFNFFFDHCFSDVRFVKNPGFGFGGLPYQCREWLDEKFILEAGHSFVDPVHYQKISQAKTKNNLVVSGFYSSFPLDRPFVTKNNEKLYLASPRVMDHQAIELLPKVDYGLGSLAKYYSQQNLLTVIKSQKPVEADTKKELEVQLAAYPTLPS